MTTLPQVRSCFEISSPSPAREAMACLIVLEGITPGTRYPVRGPMIRVGRDPRNDVVLTDPTVSRWHATLEVGRNALRLRDLDSTNGISVDGIRDRVLLVTPGAIVTLGNVRLLVVLQALEDTGPQV